MERRQAAMQRHGVICLLLMTPLKVLSTDMGYARNCAIDPCEGYYKAMGIMFPVGNMLRSDLPAKAMVLGIEIDGIAKAYPLSMVAGKSDSLTDEFGGAPIQISLSEAGQIVDVVDHQARPIPVIFANWFAWQAFHPQTTLYREIQ